ncbi:MAG: sigma-70 family RNA polymerase sigma factor [Clostridiales bacterium]|nr:sigma-70 family RNA polymerase sigma factor [Clostridiales bacterium]
MKGFSKLYEDYRALVYGFLFRLCKNADLADELTQETFYRAMSSWDKYKGESSVSTYLCAIAKRVYYTNLRKKTFLPLEAAQGEDKKTQDIADALIAGDRKMTALHMLHHLPEPYREVFTMRTFAGLDHNEIGELFGKSDSWARVTYYRARQMLQKALREEKTNE